MKTLKALLIGAVLGLAAFGVYAAYDYSHQPEKVLVRATVSAGGTLWQMVAAEMDKAGDERDVRQVLYETVNLNNIKNPHLLDVGDVVIIPLEVKK